MLNKKATFASKNIKTAIAKIKKIVATFFTFSNIDIKLETLLKFKRYKA